MSRVVVDVQEFARVKKVEDSAQHPQQENPTYQASLATELGFQVSGGLGMRNASEYLRVLTVSFL